MCVSLLTISRLLTEFHLPRLTVPENKKQEEHFPTLHSVHSQGVCVEFRVWLDNSLNFLTLLNQPLYKYLLLHWLLQLWRFKWNQQHWQGYLPLPFSIIQLNNSKATPGSEWEWSLYPPDVNLILSVEKESLSRCGSRKDLHKLVLAEYNRLVDYFRLWGPLLLGKYLIYFIFFSNAIWHYPGERRWSALDRRFSKMIISLSLSSSMRFKNNPTVNGVISSSEMTWIYESFTHQPPAAISCSIVLQYWVKWEQISASRLILIPIFNIIIQIQVYRHQPVRSKNLLH